MKDEFSTFDIEKSLDINRNTLQSAIAGGYVVPDVQEASKKDGLRARFSREGLYSVSLFFKLIQFGRSRREAREESNISWAKVGTEHKYLSISGAITREPRMKIGGATMLENYPKEDMTGEEAFRLIVNLVALKNEVDSRLDV
jgi:hypothetical protein